MLYLCFWTNKKCICRRFRYLPEQIPMCWAHRERLPLHLLDWALATVHTPLNRKHSENPYQPCPDLRSARPKGEKRHRMKCYLNFGGSSCGTRIYTTSTVALLHPCETAKEKKWLSWRVATHTVNLILARWNNNSRRIVCDRAVSAYFDAGYTLNNGTGTSGMRCPKMLREKREREKKCTKWNWTGGTLVISGFGSFFSQSATV